MMMKVTLALTLSALGGCGILGPGPGTLLEPSELCSDHGNSAIATFEDPNLEQAVRDRYGVGARNDLTCGLVSGIDRIDLSDYGITSLVGIQNLTSLTDLNLFNNLITDISPLSGLTSMTSLYLYNNSITDISALSGLASLQYLLLENNSITDISPLSGLTSLTDLSLWGNSITDISALSGLTSLRWLYLRNNSITDISALSGLTSLWWLDLLDNSITDIWALSGLTSMWRLDLSNNPDLSDIQPLFHNTGLGEPIPMSFFPRFVGLRATNVSCTDVAALRAKSFLTVASNCPWTTPIR